MKSLQDLFLHTLQDIYYAEKQIMKALPTMVETASSSELHDALSDHQFETEGQVKRLEEVFDMFGQEAGGEKCDAIEGIIKEAKDIMKACEDPDVCDAGIIASAQAVEHYEIARYGTLIAWAKQLGKDDAAQMLDETLKQERAADEKLTKIAESALNKQAA